MAKNRTDSSSADSSLIYRGEVLSQLMEVGLSASSFIPSEDFVLLCISATFERWEPVIDALKAEMTVDSEDENDDGFYDEDDVFVGFLSKENYSLLIDLCPSVKNIVETPHKHGMLRCVVFEDHDEVAGFNVPTDATSTSRLH